MAFGLSLNVKSYLGVAPILTLPGVIARILHFDFSMMLFFFYVIFILMQMLLKGKGFKAMDWLQFPIGLLVTRIVAFFTAIIPTTEDTSLIVRFFVLAAAIIVTGVGVAVSVSMDMAPNPADGLANALGERFSLGLGIGKNIVDITSVVIAFVIGMCKYHNLGTIGIGTLLAGLLVGRVIACFNYLYGQKLKLFAGIKKEEECGK